MTTTRPDVYRDSNQRYAHDVNFRAIVDMMLYCAIEHGFTPGELKQAAFLAALKAEQHSLRVASWVCSPLVEDYWKGVSELRE